MVGLAVEVAAATSVLLTVLLLVAAAAVVVVADDVDAGVGAAPYLKCTPLTCAFNLSLRLKAVEQ